MSSSERTSSNSPEGLWETWWTGLTYRGRWWFNWGQKYRAMSDAWWSVNTRRIGLVRRIAETKEEGNRTGREALTHWQLSCGRFQGFCLLLCQLFDLRCGGDRRGRWSRFCLVFREEALQLLPMGPFTFVVYSTQTGDLSVNNGSFCRNTRKMRNGWAWSASITKDHVPAGFFFLTSSNVLRAFSKNPSSPCAFPFRNRAFVLSAFFASACRWQTSVRAWWTRCEGRKERRGWEVVGRTYTLSADSIARFQFSALRWHAAMLA